MIINKEPLNTNRLIKVRSSFFCHICDFESHKFFSFKKSIVKINMENCVIMAMTFIDYVKNMNVDLVYHLREFSHVFNRDVEQEAPFDI